MPEQLEQIYLEARTALKARDYDRAADLLRQILLADENFKDASRLLAQAVKLKRRRWYNHPLLWGGLGLAALIVLGFWLAPSVRDFYASQVIPPTSTPMATPMLTPTPLPLVWKRINRADFLVNDRISLVAINPVDPDVIYISQFNDPIFRTIDHGLSWKAVQNGLDVFHINSLVIDPVDPAVLYAGAKFGSVFKSTDHGDSWHESGEGLELPVPFGEGGMGVLIMDPQDNRHLLYALYDSVYHSYDAGARWTRGNQSACPGKFDGLVIHPQDSQRLYAIESSTDGCSAGVYTSGDLGRTWILAYPVESPIRLFINPVNADLYVSIEGDLMIGFLRSQDGGLSWSQIQSEPCMGFAVSPINEMELYCGAPGSRILLSTDGGETWQEVYSKPDDWVAWIAFSPAGQEVWAAGRTLHYSTDGGQTWTDSSAGIGRTPFSLYDDPYQANSLYLQEFPNYALYHSSDGGVTWTPREMPDPRSDLSLGSSPDVLLLLNQDPKYISRDGGSTWEVLPEQDVAGYLTSPGYRMFDAHLYASMPDIIYRANHAIERSVDGGETWEACASLEATVSWLAVNPQDTTRLVAPTLGQGVVHSTDGCRSWSSGTGMENVESWDVVIDPNHPETAYAGTAVGAFVSYDGGETWTEINDGLLGATVVYKIVVDSESNVYAATPYGIFKLESK